MAEIPEVENRDGYKSYIQRRRVVPTNTEHSSVSEYDSFNEDTSVTDSSSATRNIFESKSEVKTEKSAITDFEELSLLREKYRPDEGFSDNIRKTEGKSTFIPFGLLSPKAKNPYKTNTNNYNRYPSPAQGRLSRTQTNRTPVEDNRTTLLAIKIIKQALACFAVLGVIVFMQQNIEMADEISFVKKHVVENHIELDNIISGVENIIAECSRFFGGSP